jgi:hypothetical protein
MYLWLVNFIYCVHDVEVNKYMSVHWEERMKLICVLCGQDKYYTQYVHVRYISSEVSCIQLLFTWSQAFESTTNLITFSLLLPPTCHFMSSASRVQLYILCKRGINGKCLNSLTCIVLQLSTYCDLWHFGHYVASTNSFPNIHLYTHVWSCRTTPTSSTNILLWKMIWEVCCP